MLFQIPLRKLSHVFTIQMRSIGQLFLYKPLRLRFSIRNSRVTRQINQNDPSLKPIVVSGQLSSTDDVEATNDVVQR